MMIRRMKTGAGAAVLAALLAGGLAACGDDGGPDAEFTTAAPEPTGANAPAVTAEFRKERGYIDGEMSLIKRSDLRHNYDIDNRWCGDNPAVISSVIEFTKGTDREEYFNHENRACGEALDMIMYSTAKEWPKVDLNGDEFLSSEEATQYYGKPEFFVPAQIDWSDRPNATRNETYPDVPVTSTPKRRFISDARTQSTPTPRYTPTPTPTPEPEPQQQQQSAWPDPPYPASGNMEWAKKGPFASTYTCGQAADNENPGINISECFTGPDGNAYYYFLRQAAR